MTSRPSSTLIYDWLTTMDIKNREANIIHDGDTVICEASDGRMFFQLVAAKECIRISKTLTSLTPVIGAAYGSTFEYQNQKLVKVSGGLFPDPVTPEFGEAIVPLCDNRHYTDTNSAQKLSSESIAELRSQGATGKEIIEALVENSATWKDRTEFSKQKYLRKKQTKYMPRVHILKCTAESLCKTYRLKNPDKIRYLREDTLGQILVYANIYATSQALVLDTCMGLVLGAIAERQDGNGRILAPYIGQNPCVDILRRFNFDRKSLASIHSFSFEEFALLDQREEDIAEAEASEPKLTEEEKNKMEQERTKQYTEEERKKHELKKLRRNHNRIIRQPRAVIRNWIREKSDVLILASEYDLESTFITLMPYLGDSRPFVIYSEYLEPVTKAFSSFQKMDTLIDLQLTETWTRRYQILPGRSHPEMNMSGCSGYLLTGTKIAFNSHKGKSRDS
uniref:tRNA (adenine(58)-N(1))-methyltransferase non-catalytic subunit TRM6 n=1 Tax=Albugo laibachii Nc14 TaxID=890382 RepID=F0WUK4_9STRA|nr:tRNA (adenineN(1))methyltransferase noncatalytic subunit trm6 putative [Albugo laibachii Nc14]|eukprot:CCA25085.1 tRNA (adenineN(1))methyltransferase noncatalytic subunit trm6 putative [Albugo laibachii Nc14]